MTIYVFVKALANDLKNKSPLDNFISMHEKDKDVVSHVLETCPDAYGHSDRDVGDLYTLGLANWPKFKSVIIPSVFNNTVETLYNCFKNVKFSNDICKVFSITKDEANKIEKMLSTVVKESRKRMNLDLELYSALCLCFRDCSLNFPGDPSDPEDWNVYSDDMYLDFNRLYGGYEDAWRALESSIKLWGGTQTEKVKIKSAFMDFADLLWSDSKTSLDAQMEKIPFSETEKRRSTLISLLKEAGRLTLNLKTAITAGTEHVFKKPLKSNLNRMFKESTDSIKRISVLSK